MSVAESWLILGGLFNLFLSVLVAYALYWVRLRDPDKPAQRYALVAHKLFLWNGFLLLGLASTIELTNFAPSINNGLAIVEVLFTLLAGGRTIGSWAQGIEDEIAMGGWRAGIIGLGNMTHLVVIAGILYGVARNLLHI